MHESWDEFEFQLGPPTAELAAFECRKKNIGLKWENDVSTVLDRILFILAGNNNIHESLDEDETWLVPTTGFHGNREGLKIDDFTFSRLLFI